MAAATHPSVHLEAYGATKTAEGWVLQRGGKDRTLFKEVPGGFHRFQKEDGVWRQYPYAMHAASSVEGDSGCEKSHQGLAFDAKQQAEMGGAIRPSCFDWVYPAEWFAAEYGG